MKESFDDLMESALTDVDLQPDDIPRIELYMDQILTLINDGLSKNSRKSDERPLTKTMINNYSKERLIMPVKGKKYSHEQVMQILCILNLKQMLSLGDVKCLVEQNGRDICFERAYAESLRLKEQMRDKMPELVGEAIGELEGLNTREQALAIALTLSSGANYLRRICEEMIDNSPTDETIKKTMPPLH